ncbi:MAG TPA: sulfite exporter TauE/SafE family protein [Anaerolineales bacterium]|nr:sulfite exporter TauE/SafE family protein [Anaerolineales bacterium]HNF95272.1 sulfite exporter TauE/SafE family protein [Anaerolineales bacterium]HNM35447.1 sulfite exporter TauE/SafE family protein [Anaerolineales bacterium]
MSKNQKPSVDPVIIVMLGVIFLAVAIAMIVFQPTSNSINLTADASVMSQLVVAFVTGITTGGLSCLAVQGGLLASSLAYQIEQDYSAQAKNKKATRTNSAMPIALFLIAKLVAYTLMGALLGWLGSFLTLSPLTRAILMIAIGIFMVGNALRMFNVHPIFRYFSIEPPKFITRYIRRTAKGTDTATPIFLGLLTIFIPCGVTQAMMATALGTGSVLMGAALMFAFTLGTSPVFFIVAYLATELGAKLEKFFMRFVAVVVLILGLVTLDGGLNLMGSPLSLQNMTRGWFAPQAESNAITESVQPSAASDEIILSVENNGYFPAILKAPAGKDLTLSLVTNKTYSCARDFVIPDLNFYELLPDTGTVQVNIPAQKAGSTLFFTCSMGMYTGQIVFE